MMKRTGLSVMPLSASLNLPCERSVLIVDDDDTVVANRRADVASGTLQHVNIAGNIGDLDFNFAEVTLLSQTEAPVTKEHENSNTKSACA